MSALRSWTIVCDICGDSDGHDLDAETAQERRDVLRQRDGWRVNLPGGRDVCACCRDQGRTVADAIPAKC